MNSDELLQRHVLVELDWEPSIDASKVGVTATDGIVTLTGHVLVYVERAIAERVAKRVHGVRRVVNVLVLDQPHSHRRSDDELAAAASHSIAWHAQVPRERVSATVRDGHLVLEGTVDWQFQRTAAKHAVHDLHGVRSVENRIVVASAEPNGQIKASIESALRRSALLNSKNISVELGHHKVVLTGDVHSHSEFDEAERVAWSARGVSEVDNFLTVTPWGIGPSEEWGNRLSTESETRP